MFNILLIIAVVFIMYYRTFKYTYIIDDLEVAKDPKETTKNKWRRLWEHFRGYKYTDSRLAHEITTLIHCINCCLIYIVFGSNNVALLTAILFAVNPITNQASIWLSGKPYAISTMLLLIGLIIIPLMPFIYGFCVWWSPNSLLFPSIFLMHKPYWFAILLPLIGLFFSRKFRGVYKNRKNSNPGEMTAIHPRKLIILTKSLGYYFKHCLVPLKLGMCHDYLHSFGLTPEETKKWYKIDRYFFLGCLLIVGAVVALFNRSNPISYGFLWYVFLSIQFCNFIMVNHPITERYMYLSSIGLMYALANLVIGTPFMYVFLTFYVVRLYYFMPAYENVTAYWKSNTENFPKVAMGYNQYGLGLVQYGNHGSAIDVWIRGVQERPHDFRLNYNLANIMLGTGNTAHAAQFLATAEKNLDRNNNFDFWMKNINEMKKEIEKRGFKYEYALP